MVSIIPKISVIVPVYKAEKYLHKCVDSILAQTFTDFELLLVDDGSPDRSGEICDEYAAKDSRIKVFHKENGGVSSARQCGMDHAEGEYSIHADPDDWVEPTMLEELYRKAKEEDADMVMCDYLEEYRHKQRYIPQTPTSLQSDSLLREFMMGVLHGGLWCKLIRRDCYGKYNIKFPPVVVWEDLYVVCELLRNDIKVAYLNKAFYHYDLFSNISSITRYKSLKNLDSQKLFIRHFEDVLSAVNYQKELFRVKCATKELAWCVRELPVYEFIALYDDEVNEYYKSSGFNLLSFKFYIKLSLLGYDKLSRILFDAVFQYAIPVAKRILNR